MDAAEFATLRDQLKRDEGLRLLPYLDTENKISIGYGRNLSDSGITQLEAEDMLTADIVRHWDDLLRAFPIVPTLAPARQIVLGNMCFNLGIVRLAAFVQMWKAIHRGDFVKAANEMLDSQWAHQVGARATRLASSMASGELK